MPTREMRKALSKPCVLKSIPKIEWRKQLPLPSASNFYATTSGIPRYNSVKSPKKPLQALSTPMR